jgi:rod shape-determining protein MreD
MTARTVGRILIVVFTVLVLQWTVALDIHVGGVHPDLMLLLPIAAGVAAGAEEGAIVGFVAGFAADLLLPTPMGLSALVGGLVGFAVGVSTGSTTREVWWFPSVVALGASAAGVVTYALLGAVLGQGQFVDVDLPAVVAVVAVANAVLAVPAVRVATWMFRPTAPSGLRTAGARR